MLYLRSFLRTWRKHDLLTEQEVQDLLSLCGNFLQRSVDGDTSTAVVAIRQTNCLMPTVDADCDTRTTRLTLPCTSHRLSVGHAHARVADMKIDAYKKLSYRWQSLTNRAMLVCKVVEVWKDFLSEYVDKKFSYICYRRLIRHEWIYYDSKNCVDMKIDA